jgi:hypothetical protein
MEKINIFFRHPFPEKKGMSTFPGENVIFHVRNAPQPFRLWITIQKFLKIPQIRGFLNGYPQKNGLCRITTACSGGICKKSGSCL